MASGNDSVGCNVRLLVQRANGTQSVYHGQVTSLSESSITVITRFGEKITVPLSFTIIEWLR